MRRSLRRLVPLALLAALVLPAAAPGDEREEALEEIRGEIARLQSRLARVQRERASIANEVEATRIELQLQEQRVAEAVAAQELAAQRVTTLEDRIVELEDSLARVKEDLHGRLAALYRLGRAGYLRLILSLEDGGGALPAIRQLRFLARRDGQILERYLDARVQLDVEQEALEKERHRVAAWVAQEEGRRRELAELERRQAVLLARLERERTSLQSRASELEDKERKLANFVAFLYGRNPTPLSGTPIQEFQGVLDWPVRGAVTEGFGPRSDPRYGTRVPHNGIQIAAPRGSAVKAVFPGKVLYAQPFKGYGPTVIVHHPGRVFTLYAGLADVRVGVGHVVTLGQTVGAAADHLYFEIRIENRPVDPREWLRN